MDCMYKNCTLELIVHNDNCWRKDVLSCVSTLAAGLWPSGDH